MAFILPILEISGLGTEITYAEFRNSNLKNNYEAKVAGIFKSQDVIFKRGIMSTNCLNEWLDNSSVVSERVDKTITIMMRDESESDVIRWQLTKARIVKLTSPIFSESDTVVAIEELVLTAENIEIV